MLFLLFKKKKNGWFSFSFKLTFIYVHVYLVKAMFLRIDAYVYAVVVDVVVV